MREGLAGETIRFRQIASGSASEVENHLLIAGDLGDVRDGDRDRLLGELQAVRRVLAGLMRNLPE